MLLSHCILRGIRSVTRVYRYKYPLLLLSFCLLIPICQGNTVRDGGIAISTPFCYCHIVYLGLFVRGIRSWTAVYRYKYPLLLSHCIFKPLCHQNSPLKLFFFYEFLFQDSTVHHGAVTPRCY